ncbi:hypothetical protein [Mycobacteroides abscessus]|nr:hypothetical protein [Mycobacteroides abscessus]
MAATVAVTVVVTVVVDAAVALSDDAQPTKHSVTTARTEKATIFIRGAIS